MARMVEMIRSSSVPATLMQAAARGVSMRMYVIELLQREWQKDASNAGDPRT